VSSRDRNRSTRQNQPAPAPSSSYSDDVVYDDDVLYEEDWNDAGAYYEPEATPPSSTRTSRQQPAASQGTASQIDRLRRNIGRASRSGSSWQQPPPASQPATSQRRTQRPAQAARPAPAYSYDDDTYSTIALTRRRHARPVEPRLPRPAIAPHRSGPQLTPSPTTTTIRATTPMTMSTRTISPNTMLQYAHHAQRVQSPSSACRLYRGRHFRLPSPMLTS
jgi:hypothetical protein